MSWRANWLGESYQKHSVGGRNLENVDQRLIRKLLLQGKGLVINYIIGDPEN